MTDHTPTPWVASNQYLYADNRTLPVASGQQDWATNPGGPNYVEACANAAFIVKAVNAHDALVKALKSLTNEVSGIFDAFEYGIRQEISNTNFAVVCDKLEEANRVLGNVLVPSQNDQSDPDVIREGKAKWPY